LGWEIEDWDWIDLEMSVIDDVLIVGGGPAGAVAATVLARAGARVRIVDRASFPRDKLCGDSLNPGTLGILRRLGLAAEVEREGLAVEGMLVTGQVGRTLVSVLGRYPPGVHGRSLSRRDLDWALLREAARAGAQVETGVAVREALLDESAGGPVVHGVKTGSNGTSRELKARVTIAADGRGSVLARSLGLSRPAEKPRRWAIGVYFEQSGERTSFGEMHIRRGRYIGVAPLSDGLVNVCLVKASGAGDPDLRRPEAALRRELEADPLLSDRFSGAKLARAPVVLGPLAVDAIGASIDGLVTAGDAAGFIDPITGDGLRFATRGGELAARAALRALEHGWPGVHAWLAAERRDAFRSKWRFNRAVRRLVGSAHAVRAAALGALVAPCVVKAVINYAGDCGLHGPSALPLEAPVPARPAIETIVAPAKQDSARK
jgi:flavin-dependent dehydrogenase